MNGVSLYGLWSYKFISVDGTRSAFDDSDCKYPSKCVDKIIPQSAHIRKVETLLSKSLGHLIGFKWIGDDGTVLVAVGGIDDPDNRNDPDYVLQSFTLNHNQRLVGVRSGSGGYIRAEHYSF